MSTLSEYNNNPGNIKPPGGKADFYEGQIGVDDNGFAVFVNRDFGRKALIQDIRAKQQKGVNTPHTFIDRYAPAGKENTEEARDNYKLTLTAGLGLKGTNEQFPPGSEEKLADLITQFEGQSQAAQSAEPKPGDALKQDIPGLSTVLSTSGGPPPPKADKEEGVSPIWGAPAGALATAVGMASDYTEPKPVDVAGARKEYGTTMEGLDLERQAAETKAQGEYHIAMQKAQNAVDLAEQKAVFAQLRLQERMANPEGFAGGPSLQQLDAEFQAAQQEYQTARQTLAEATAAAKAKAPVPAATEAAVPQQIITDPNAPMVRTPSEQVYEGTIDPETGTTGRQRQGYNEVTSYQALQRSEQEKALRAAREKGLVPDVGESARLTFGAPTSTRAGVLVQSDTGAPIKAQQELEDRQAAQQAAEQKMQENLEMERIKNEALLARQKQSEAGAAVKEAKKFQQKRVSDLQEAAGTAQTKAEEARLGLPLAQQQAQADLQLAQQLADLKRTKGADAAAAKLAEIEAKAPGTIARLTRLPALVGTGMTQPSGVISSSGKLAFGAGAGMYGLMSYNELLDRYKKGERDPALLAELAAKSGLSAAALMPAVGPWTARMKGAGVLGTTVMAVRDLSHILSDAEKIVSAREAVEKKLSELRPNP